MKLVNLLVITLPVVLYGYETWSLSLSLSEVITVSEC